MGCATPHGYDLYTTKKTEDKTVITGTPSSSEEKMQLEEIHKAIFVYVAICMINPDFTTAAYSTQLLSISELEMHPNTYISGFEIETWNIRVRAVCKIPLGWIITAGRDISPLGKLIGSASGFMANLDIKQISEDHDLDDLFLIDDLSRAPRSPTEPPTFVGKIIAGEFFKGRPARDRIIKLKESNVVLTSATECPRPASDEK